MMYSSSMINVVSIDKLYIGLPKSVNTDYQSVDLLNLEVVY